MAIPDEVRRLPRERPAASPPDPTWPVMEVAAIGAVAIVVFALIWLAIRARR